MNGLHLTADLDGCRDTLAPMTQPQALRTLCLAAVRAAGLRAVGELFHPFPAAGTPAAAVARAPGGTAGQVAQVGQVDPIGQDTDPAAGGVTGVVLLAESHLAVHTWPERGAVTLDVFVCNVGGDNSARAEALLAALVAAFEPRRVQRQSLRRGRFDTVAA